MAGQDSAQERTEQPTEKRLEEARIKGEVPRSRELDTCAILGAGLLALALFGHSAVRAFRALSSERWQFDRRSAYEESALLEALGEFIVQTLLIGGPFLGVMFLANFLGQLLMNGGKFHFSALRLDISRLNPFTGIKRVFGIQSLPELLKSVLKVLLLGGMVVLVLRTRLDEFLRIGTLPPGPAVMAAFSLLSTIGIAMIVVMILVALIDVPYQRWSHARKLRMTRQEIRDESKETTGNPEMKAKVRSVQQSISQRRMLRDMPTASVVLTNPTHYSVALRYDEALAAPRVLAKGVDHMALHIRRLANEHDVPLFEAPLLTRALYRHSEVGDDIPAELYLAVAQVLAYVFQFEQADLLTRRRLVRPSALPIPQRFQDPD